MIARHWRGWTTAHDGLKKIEGYRGGYVLRHDERLETEFVVVNFFDSLEVVQEFAGSDYKTPVFEPEARRLLLRIEPVAMHYQVRISTI